MTKTTCGYTAINHFCGDKVRFISRYRNQSDYCLNGKRLRVYDDGTVRHATPDDLKALEEYFRSERAAYEVWHAEMAQRHGAGWPALEPYSAPALRMEEVAV